MNIVVLDGYCLNHGDLSWEPLEELGKLKVYKRSKTLPQILDRTKDAHIILTHRVPLNRDLLDLLTRLRFISLLSQEYEIIDINYCNQLKLPVSNIPSISTDLLDGVRKETRQYCMDVAIQNVRYFLEDKPQNLVTKY